MNILYKVTAFKQWNPSPVYPDDKWKLVELCHNSFLKAKRDEPVTYLLDRCAQWADYFSQYGKVVNWTTGTGYDVIGSVKHTFEYIYNNNLEGKILMLEDDYLWRPDTIKYLWQGLDRFKLVSPYDHPGHYTEEKYKDFQYQLKLIGNIVWRNSPGNTHTFGTTAEYLREKWDIFRLGHYDSQLYEALKPDQVWNPVPSFATHMVSFCMAPIIDWKELYVGK